MADAAVKFHRAACRPVNLVRGGSVEL
jgi:hypothetical protein